MTTPLPQLLSLAPQGVIVDERGAYRGLAPWFDARLTGEMLRRYNEHGPLLALVEDWTRRRDTRREAAYALARARGLAGLMEARTLAALDAAEAAARQDCHAPLPGGRRATDRAAESSRAEPS